MIKAMKDIWNFSGSESGNLRNSILFGFLVGIGRMIEMAGVFVIITAIINGVTEKAPAWQAFLLVSAGVLIACFRGKVPWQYRLHLHKRYFLPAIVP